jgi:hypothetical protein
VSQSTMSPMPSTQGRPRGLLIASILCWLEGLLIAFSGALGALEDFGSRAALFDLGWCVVALALCVAGYMLRRARRRGGAIAVLGAGLFSVALLDELRRGTLRDAPTTVALLALNILIVTLVGRNWRRLRPWGGHVGA